MFRVREIKYLLFLIRLWNHYPRKNEARQVDVGIHGYTGYKAYTWVYMAYPHRRLTTVGRTLCCYKTSNLPHQTLLISIPLSYPKHCPKEEPAMSQ